LPTAWSKVNVTLHNIIIKWIDCKLTNKQGIFKWESPLFLFLYQYIFGGFWIMSISVNKVFLAGNLTRDVELRYTPSGTAVTDIGVAVNERRKNSAGEWVEEPLFVDVTLWGRTAEIANEYLKKGSGVHIEGSLRLDQWEVDGEKRSKLKVVASRMQMFPKRNGDSAPPASTSNEPTTTVENSNDKDDIPF
jgi:single-strand DNA-binding protein